MLRNYQLVLTAQEQCPKQETSLPVPSSMDRQQQQLRRQEQQAWQQWPAPLSQVVGKEDEPDECELSQLLDSLSEESKSLFKILTLTITMKFKNEIKLLKDELSAKNTQLAKLNEEISDRKTKVQVLKTSIDSVDQYERWDNVIISGPLLLDESREDNATNVIKTIVKEHLQVNISESDINISHRIGPIHSQQHREAEQPNLEI